MLARLLSVAVAVLVLGCGGDGGPGIIDPDPVDVQGTWSGTFPADSGAQDVSLELKLTESSGAVSGTGTLVSSAGTFPLTVNGTYDSPAALHRPLHGRLRAGESRGARVGNEHDGHGGRWGLQQRDVHAEQAVARTAG